MTIDTGNSVILRGCRWVKPPVFLLKGSMSRVGVAVRSRSDSFKPVRLWRVQSSLLAGWCNSLPPVQL